MTTRPNQTEDTQYMKAWHLFKFAGAQCLKQNECIQENWGYNYSTTLNLVKKSDQYKLSQNFLSQIY